MIDVNKPAADGFNDRSIRSVYVILILVTLSIASGRIATVISREGDTAFLSANDRSRWCTIAALVENGTYEIDPFLQRRGAKQNRRPWYTIDLVRHVGSDGELHYYSSKPPLLPTIYAGVYWCVTRTMGMWLSDFPIYVGRIVLWLVNIPTLALFLIATIAAIDRVSTGAWAKTFLAASVCFGTMLVPFSISLNNHLPAAASTAVVLYFFVRSFDHRVSQWGWLVAGLAGGMTAANELPALSMTVFWAGLLLLTERRGLLSYLAGVAVVAAAFFATNWVAHESLRPPYAHRGNGALIAEENQLGVEELGVEEWVRAELIGKKLADENSKIEMGGSREPDRKRVVVDNHRQFALLELTESSGDDRGWQLRHWDDWYDYPASYWVDGKRRGVDRGEPSQSTYLLHLTIGHYGIFSLTAIWLLMPIGLVFGVTWKQTKHQLLLASIALATLVCITFYVMRPEIDRNYGGVSVCFRWLLWFAPLWLFAMTGPVHWLSRNPLGRGLAVLLLAASVFSMSTALQSPWQSPWLYRFWVFLGWIAP